MRIHALLTISLLTVTGAVLAEQSALESAGTQMLKNMATEATPKEVVQGAQSAGKAVGKTKSLKESTEKAPEALQKQAEETAKQKASELVPEEAKEGAKAAKEGTQTVKKATGTLKDPSKAAKEATGAAKAKAQQEATEKALDLLH